VNGSGGSWTVANGTVNFVSDTDGDAPIFSTQSAGGGVSVTVLANIILTNNTIFTPGSIPTQVAGNITGAGGLLASGPGPLLLSGISTYTGVTVVDGGPLQAGSSTAFSSSSSYGVSSVLDLNGFSNSIGTLIGGGTVTNTGPGVAILTVGAKGTNFSFFGNLEDGGVGSTLGLTKTGGGIMTLSGINTYTGPTEVSGGTLQPGGPNTFSPNSPFTVDAGATLDLRRNSVTILSLSGAGTVTDSGITNPDTLHIVSNPGSITVFSGTIVKGLSMFSSPLALSLSSNGAIGSALPTLILSGNNTYVGGTTISNYILQLGNGGDSGSIPGDVVNNGGLLVFNHTPTGTFEFDGAISGTGSVEVASGTQILNSSNNTYSGLTTIDQGATLIAGGSNASLSPNSDFVVNGILDLDGQNRTVGSLAGTGTVTNSHGNGFPVVLTAGDTLNTNFSGNLVDGGSSLGLTKVGSGVMTLSGTNTYSGPTTVTEGTLQAGSGGAFSAQSAFTVNTSTLDLNGFNNGIGSLAGNGTVLNSNAALAVLTTGSDGTSTIFSGDLPSGPLGLTKVGAGILTLSGGASFYSGPTTVSGGTLQAGSNQAFSATSAYTVSGTGILDLAGFSNQVGSLSGNGIVTNSGSALAILTTGGNGTDTIFTGTLSDGLGPLGLSKEGGGTFEIASTNTYSGETVAFGGVLEAGANNALGMAPVVMRSGTLVIAAGVTLNNLVEFATGGTFMNFGTLENNVINGGTVPGLAVLPDGPGAPTMVVNSGTINGFVDLSAGNVSVRLLTGSLITGSITINGSTPGAVLIFDGAGQQLLSQAVLGSVTNNGRLGKEGSGTWIVDVPLGAPLGTDILSGTLVVNAALSTGGVTIASQSTLQLNSASNIGYVLNSGSLVFAGSGPLTVGGNISGTGNVRQAGTGTTILSGNNSYSGGTVISQGTLLVNSPTALGTGDVTVSGGVLGADPQPIDVGGNYVQGAGGTLALTIAGRARGQFDTLNVAGNASLNGTLQLLNGGYTPQGGDKLQVVLAAGALAGRFAQVKDPFLSNASFNTIDVVYARQSVTLEFLELRSPPQPPGPPAPPAPPGTPDVIMTTDFSSFAFTPNQLASARLLDAAQLNARAGDLFSFLNNEPFSNIPSDLDKISPEGLSAFYEIGFSNSNLQRLNLEGRLDDLREGARGFSSNMKVNGASVNLEGKADLDGKSSAVEPALSPAPENRWGVWASGFGDFVSVDADANAAGYNFTTGGVSVGVDYRLTNSLVIGAFGEYSHTRTSLEPSGSIDVNSGLGGVYATWFSHGAYLNGGIYGGGADYSSGRASLGGLANGSTSGSQWSTFLSGGYDFHLGELTVGPTAALQYTSVNIDDFSENGSLTPLTIHSGSAESLRTDVGFRLFYRWKIGSVTLEPSLKAAWEHEYKYSALPVNASLSGFGGPTATFIGPAEGHDSAIISAGISAQLNRALSIYLSYDGQLGRSNYDSNAVSGGIRFNF
jgi:outer membrane autotransporter protein